MQKEELVPHPKIIKKYHVAFFNIKKKHGKISIKMDLAGSPPVPFKYKNE